MFKCLRTIEISQYFIYKDIKSKLNSENADYYSVQSLLSYRLIYKNKKIKKYKSTILSVILCGCETWSVTLREKYRLRVFEMRVVRRIFGPKREEGTGD
jgi:hypothetical protein